MNKLLTLIKNKYRGGIAMMLNLYVKQIEKGWITLEQVPKRHREKVRQLLEFEGIIPKTEDDTEE